MFIGFDERRILGHSDDDNLGDDLLGDDDESDDDAKPGANRGGAWLAGGRG